ncbi:MAG TPA: biotin transporter BioY [Gemmatimonadales bacterium]|jgi:biotin transport system substrate-specific component
MTNAVVVARADAKPVGVKVVAALVGALVVAAAAQVAIPIPGSLVPFTLQPMAVLIVGGLLGARYGALSLAIYLAMGAAGLPVFAPFGLPGLARLLGPTGGFLLSYPVAAATVGLINGRAAAWPLSRAMIACLAGMLVIFAGGVSQLAILGANAGAIITPFLAADLLKVAVAGLVIRRFAR